MGGGGAGGGGGERGNFLSLTKNMLLFPCLVRSLLCRVLLSAVGRVGQGAEYAYVVWCVWWSD